MILCAGEALIDWVSRERGAGLDRARLFEPAPGGAPLNVAVGLARLGVPVGFAGCLAEDPFGDLLAGLLAREGVDTTLVRRVLGCQTRMAYVTTNDEGDRELPGVGRCSRRGGRRRRQFHRLERDASRRDGTQSSATSAAGSSPVSHAASASSSASTTGMRSWILAASPADSVVTIVAAGTFSPFTIA